MKLINFLQNCYYLFHFLKDCHFEYKNHHIVLEYEGSIIHLDSNGHLSIRPRGYLLNHCTLQEVMEQNTNIEQEVHHNGCCS